MTKYYKNAPVRKRFGQNFLTNRNILDQIIYKLNLSKDDFVLEIGPGHGAMTELMIDQVKHLTAVEIDRDLVGELTEKFKAKNNFELVSQDILDFDFNNLTDLKNYPLENRRAIGNIPYYITTPIIMKFINENSLKTKGISKTDQVFSELTIMIQKEVGDRLVAKAGTKEYGALSVIGQYACDIETLVYVGRENFYPKPKVDSVVVRLKMKTEDTHNIQNPKIFWRLVHAVFTSRRKTLRNSLKIAGFSNELISKVANDTSLDIRGEIMDIGAFCRLSNIISSYES